MLYSKRIINDILNIDKSDNMGTVQNVKFSYIIKQS